MDDFQAVLLLNPGNEEAAEKIKEVVEMRDLAPVAILSGDMKEINRVFGNGADVNFRGSAGFSPLYIASENGHLKIVELLLSKGASVHDKIVMRALVL